MNAQTRPSLRQAIPLLAAVALRAGAATVNVTDFAELKSAVANLQQTEAGAAAGTESISVSKVCVDKGPMMKRIHPRAQGRAFRIEKKLSHVTVEVTAEG